MAITLKRQLTEDEKTVIVQRFGRLCYATGHAIPDGESMHFDHIKAFTLGGLSEIDNIAPMCEHHNKAKGMLPLEDFRIKLKLEDFFQVGDRLTLKHLLRYLKDGKLIKTFGESVACNISDSTITIENHSYKSTHEIQKCPLTGWKYFYAPLPIAVLDSDDDDENDIGLQPRYLIFDKVFEMFRHFQVYPVLQPSIGRLSKNKLVLFDGQHKAAALLWNNRENFECKIYIDPDLRKLNQANISAHDKFAQTRFFSAIMILKLGQQFGKDFEAYKNLEDGQVKSEAGFLAYLERVQDTTMTRGERNKRFRSYLYNSILDDPDNKLKPLISASNRSSNEQPITIDMLSKSVLSSFLNTEPVKDNMASDAYKREFEFKNNLRLLNLLFDLALSSWNPKPTPNDLMQQKLSRIFSSKSIMAWSEIFRDALLAKLDIQDQEERERPFYRDLTDADFVGIRKLLERLLSWSLWAAPKDHEIDSYISSNKSNLKDWFKLKGLTTGYLLGASE